MRFYRAVKKLLEAVTDVPPPPPAIIQKAEDTKLTFNDVMDFIKQHEGYRPHVYKDSLGIPTVGIGLNLTRPDAPAILKQVGADYNEIIAGKADLTDEQIKEIFKRTLSIAYQDAKKWIPNFDGVPKNIKLGILDMSFNMGYTRLSKFQKTRQYIVSKQYDKAAAEIQQSKWATQVGNRVKSIVNLFSSV